jgi:hypothetical protein
MSKSFCLSIHVAYRCHHSGACCTAGWPIPAEPPVVEAIELHFGARSGRLLREPGSSAADPAILVTETDGACTFFDAEHGRLCAIHRDIGERLLPSACRQFPRVTLADPRGTWITLSHFCPTAASLLFVPSPPGSLQIVPAPDTISLSGTAEGLDATTALPPLLRPGMLADLEGYDAWERSAVAMLDNVGHDVDTAVAALHAATLEIRRWSPGAETLRDLVLRVMRETFETPAAEDPDADAGRYARAVASVPRGLTVPDSALSIERFSHSIAVLWREFDRVIRRYLASKLFAGWWPYLGLDLLSIVEIVRVHQAVLRTNIGHRLARQETGHAKTEVMLEAIRDTDLLMVHLSDSRALARLITSTLAGLAAAPEKP